MEQVRRQGYSVDCNENEDGVNCIGAPVGIVGHERVAISVSGPTTRFSTNRIPEFAALVVEAARAISAELDQPGHRLPWYYRLNIREDT